MVCPPDTRTEGIIISNITVIDSLMGSGKTTWAIEFMNANSDKSFIYCTPRLAEINRIKSACKNRKFYEPLNRGKGKRDNFNDLLLDGKDIAVTHCTFSNSNDRTTQLLQENNYTLILDETLDILVDFNNACGDNINKRDINLLIKEKFIAVNEYGKVSWIKPSYNGSKYSNVERVATSGNLFLLDESMMVWQFPPELFSLFDSVYILTYAFEASFLCPYFDYHGIDYLTRSIASDTNGFPVLSEYNDYLEDRQQLKKLIHILDNKKMNNYRARSLSKSSFRRMHKDELCEIKGHFTNFVKNITKAKSCQVMWTTFKDFKKYLKGAGYTRTRRLTDEERESTEEARERAEYLTSCFVPCNERGVNDFSDRNVLIYGLNLYPNQFIVRYFDNKNKADGTQIKINADYYALSSMLQWIWRSAIRDGNPIQIYIPSTRMRNLLINWLDGKIL